MGKFVCLLLMMMTCLFTDAQTQKGIVKTKGRMVNGKLKPGEGLPGTIITIQGRNAIYVQNSDGSFSFPIPNREFRLINVQYKNLKPIDTDVIGKTYQYSSNPLYLVMETQDQQQADLLNHERKLRQSLEKRIQQREEEIDRLKISLKEKNKMLEKIKKDREENEIIIHNLSKYYASIDYDQLDSFQQQVTNLLENGELTKADSLLRTRGDLNGRIQEIKKQQKEIEKVDSFIAKAKEKSKKELEDAALDCYNYHLLCLFRHSNDSAAYYMNLRADLDTLNQTWQYEAAEVLDTYLNDYKNAIFYYQRVLRQSLIQNGEESNETINAYNHIGVAYTYMGDTIQALKHIQKALDIGVRLFGTEHPEIADSYNNLGGIYYMQGNYAKALEHHLKALEIREKIYGKEHPDVAQSYNNLGLAYNGLKDKDNELDCMQQALVIYAKIYGDRHPEVASSYYNLGGTFYELENYEYAAFFFEHAMDIWRETYGDRHLKIADCHYFMGLIHEANDEQEKAIYDYQKALEIYEKSTGTVSNGYANTLFHIYNIFYKQSSEEEEQQEKLRQALQYALKAAKVFKDLSNVALCYSDAGAFCYMLKDYQKSLEYSLKALEIRQKVLPKEHAETAMSLSNVAAAYSTLHDYDKAIDYCRKALEIKEKVLGKDDPETKMTEEDLKLYLEMKKASE